MFESIKLEIEIMFAIFYWGYYLLYNRSCSSSHYVSLAASDPMIKQEVQNLEKLSMKSLKCKTLFLNWIIVSSCTASKGLCLNDEMMPSSIF